MLGSFSARFVQVHRKLDLLFISNFQLSSCRFLNNLKATELEDDRKTLYSTHIPTSANQKLMLFVGSSLISLMDPYRDGLFVYF